MADVKYRCNHCNASLKSPTELKGEVIDCPACNGRVLVGNQHYIAEQPPNPPPIRTKLLLIRGFIGGVCGLIFGLCALALEGPYPQLLNILGKPAEVIFEIWHQLGLPPQGEAALAGSFFTFFIMWIVLGAIIGSLTGFRRPASYAPPK